MRKIADAVLYEGYVLWPYRKSALKNQRRWTFGGVYPRAHSERHDDDPWRMRTQCLVEAGPSTTAEVGVRFLQVVRRDLTEHTPDGPRPVEELLLDGRRHLAWDEAVEREVSAAGLAITGLRKPQRLRIAIPAGAEEEGLCDAAGRSVGTITRRWEHLAGAVEIHAEPAAEGVLRLTVTITNTSPWEGGPRETALRRTFCSTHTVLRVAGGAFISSTDPPVALSDAAAECRNEHTWPVMVGEPGALDTMLSAPIILEDYPQIAPESPGDLFDGGEIDQMLVLNILSLTDEERAEMRGSDPRTREILERTEGLTEEQLMALHGSVREFGLARSR